MLKKFLNLQTITYFLYVFSFIIFFWVLSDSYLNGGYIIAGHDSGLPLNTKEFLNARFFAWDERIGFGQDNSVLFGSIILHSFDHLFAYLSGFPAAGNAIALTFWLSLIFISAFIFALSLKDTLGKYFPYIFPPLISVNFYIFQSVFILERSKYGLVAALLLFIAIMFKLKNKKIGIIPASILTTVIFFVLNGGGWIGLPLYGGVVIFTLTFLVLEIISGVLNFSLRGVLRILSFLLLSSFLLGILSSYSILPYFITFKNADSVLLNDLSMKQAYIEWIGSLSHGASYLNLFRLQGVPDWFSNQYVLSSGHPFAQTYFDSPLLVAASFIFPILALLSFKLAGNSSQKKVLFYFWVLSLVSIFFTAGTHPPLGVLYEFIFNNVPGFVIFRSPYYKFGSLMFISLSVLIAFSISSFIALVELKFKTEKIKKIIVPLLITLSIFSWLGFHFKLYQKDIFSWQKGFSSRVKLPEYIYDFETYTSQNLGDERILLLPPLDSEWRNDGYSFGYWSLSTLQYSLSPKNYLVNGFGLNREEAGWVNNLYLYIHNGNEEDFYKLAKKLNVRYILFRGDAASLDVPLSGDVSEQYEKIIDSFSKVEKIKVFGKWSLYKIRDSVNNSVSLSGSVALIAKDDADLARIFLSDKESVLYEKENDIGQNLDRLSEVKAFSLQCSTCVLETLDPSNNLPEVTILPDSLFYKLKEYRERREIENATDEGSKISSYVAFILRRTAENFRMITFGAKEKFLQSNTETINTYLDRINGLISTSSDPETDYSTAIGLLSGIAPVENNLKNYIGDKEFLVRSEQLRNTVIDTMVKIYKIKSYYLPMLKDPSFLRYEKRYLVSSFPENSILYLKTLTLPRDDKNMPIYPSQLIIQQGERKTSLSFEKNTQEWLRVRVPDLGKSGGYISLKFDNFANLYSPGGMAIKTSPTGEKSCLVSKIQNFNPQKVYEVSVQAKPENQSIKLIFMDEQTEEGFNFLIGRPEVNIYPILSYEPYRYVYHPGDKIKNPTVYLCSDNKEIPRIESVSIYEIFAPQLVMVQEKAFSPLSDLPVINVKKQDTTKYIVEIKNAQRPFILVLNQRFSPLWIMTEDENLLKKLKVALSGKKDTNHLLINGYANGWLIEKTGNYTVTLEYVPQIFFIAGLKITGVAVISLIIYFGTVIYKNHLRKKRNA